MEIDLTVLLGGVVTGILALARITLIQHRSLVDRFVQFVEVTIGRQEDSAEQMAKALRDLAEGTHENTATLRRMGEQLGVVFNKGS